MIVLPVRAEIVFRGEHNPKVRTSFRIVDANGDYVASVVSGWGRSDDQRERRANEIVRLLNQRQ